MSRSRLRPAAEAAVFLLAAALWLAPLAAHPTGFPFWRGGSFSDLAISHWPNAHFLRQALLTWRQVPLWNPLILGGAPFAADPLSGLWYPPVWLAVILPPTLAFNILFWLHLAWGGWGTCRLLRAQGVSSGGAFIGGLAFCGTPKLVGHVGLGHLSLVMAVSWTPWVVALVRRAGVAAASGARGWPRWAAWAGGALGAVFIADPRWALPAGALAAADGLRAWWSHPLRPTGRLRRGAAAAGLGSALAAAIAAGLALPLIEFTRLSTRAALAPADQMSLSLPPARLLGLLIPDRGGWPEWATYVGIAVLTLAVVALVTRAAGAGFWACVAVVAWLLALGGYTPLYALVSSVLPGAGLLRVPPRFLFIAAFAAAMLCGLGADRLLAGGLAGAARRAVRLSVTGLAAVALGLLAAAWRPAHLGAAGQAAGPLLGDAALALAAWALAMLSLSPRWPRRVLAVGWALLVAADLGWVSASTLQVRPLDQVLGVREALAGELAAGFGVERVFSPSYSLPQQSAARAGLELADGVNPLQLRSTWQAMAQAAGFATQGYSVTLPPFPSGDPAAAWGARLDARLLGLMNVGAVVSEYPIEAPGFSPPRQTDGAWVYRNLAMRPRAWVQDEADGGSNWRPVGRMDWSPNAIAVDAAGPGMLVLSEVAFPGWRVRIDGRPAELVTVDGLLRGVRLPAGEHAVVFAFKPASVFAGAAISLLGVLALVALGVRR